MQKVYFCIVSINIFVLTCTLFTDLTKQNDDDMYLQQHKRVQSKYFRKISALLIVLKLIKDLKKIVKKKK